MSAKKVQTRAWPVKTTNPPKLNNVEWGLSGVAGVTLLAMAILQLISFADFRDSFEASGLSSPTAWAVGVIVAELWGAAGFFKIPLSALFRQVSYTLAVVAAGFWFVYALQLVAGTNANVDNTGFFGRFLSQTPGWWTVIEASVLLFWILYKVNLFQSSSPATKRK